MSFMGAWGVGIFSNDDAADLREEFRELIAEGLSAGEATQRLVTEYGIGDGGVDDHDFWLALAATQHSLGRIVPEVVDRARGIVDDAGELERWPTAERKRRKAALARLRDTLMQPPPSPKRVRRRSKVDTRLEAGQHIVVPLDGQREILVRVTGVNEDKGGRYPEVVVLAWDGTEEQLRKAHRLHTLLSPSPLRDREAMGFLLIGQPHDPEEIRLLSVRTDRRTPKRRWQAGWVSTWSDLARFFDADGSPELP